MPYRLSGKKIMHMKNGKWSLKQVAKSEKNAKAALRLLLAVEHGFKPTGKKKK